MSWSGHFAVLLRSSNLRNCAGSRTEASQNGESGKSRCLENALCVGDKQSSSLCHTANCHGVLCWILSHTRGCLWFSQHLRCDACSVAEDFTHEPITMTVNAYLKRKKYTWLSGLSWLEIHSCQDKADIADASVWNEWPTECAILEFQSSSYCTDGPSLQQATKSF